MISEKKEICFEKIVTALGGNSSSDSTKCFCPAHDDGKNPSLVVSRKDGKILFHCFSGICSQEAVMEALRTRGLWPKRSETKTPGPIALAPYIYTDAVGNPVLQVERIDEPGGKKCFVQRRMEEGFWVKGGVRDKSIVTPYRYKEWKDLDRTVLVEGEKCADALWLIGVPATTTPGGSSAWREHYAGFFRGKSVVILPDADLPGAKYAKAALKDIEPASVSVTICEIPGLKNGEDVFDWIQRGGTREDLEKLFSSSGASSKADTLAIKCLNDVESTKVDWLWKDRIPFGALTIVCGIGGSGKSSAMAAVCADLTTGRALPGDVAKDPICILLLAVEDDPGSVLRPRFEAQGADLKKVFSRDQSLLLNEPTMNALRAVIEGTSVRLMVIDPIVAFLNGKDSNKAGEVRDILKPLADLARETNCAIVLVAHFNKSDSSSASNRIAGSSDFRNAPRSVLQVTKTDDGAYIALEKSNYAARAKTLKFAIENGRLEWRGECDLTADQVLNEARESPAAGSAVDAAKEFLRAELADGPIDSKALLRAADDAGISRSTLERARNKFATAIRVAGKWMVELQEPQATQPQKVEVLEDVEGVTRVKVRSISNDATEELQEHQDLDEGLDEDLNQTSLFEEVV